MHTSSEMSFFSCYYILQNGSVRYRSYYLIDLCSIINISTIRKLPDYGGYLSYAIYECNAQSSLCCYLLQRSLTPLDTVSRHPVLSSRGAETQPDDF